MNGIIKLKKIILIVIALFGLIAIVVDQRTNLLIYLMTTEGLPDLLEPKDEGDEVRWFDDCLLYTSPSPRDGLLSRMPSSA